MLLRWDVQKPGTLQLLPAPVPTWDCVRFESSYAVDTAQTGDATGSVGPQLKPVKEWLRGITYGGFGKQTMSFISLV